MKLKLVAGAAITVLAATTAACSGGQPATAPTAQNSSSAIGATATPTPSETAAAVDPKALRVTEGDLGSGWKSTSSQDARPMGECNAAGLPGGLSSKEVSYGTFQARQGAHPAQLSVGVLVLAPPDDTTLEAAIRGEIKKCDGKSKYGWYLVSSFDDVRTVKGAAQVLLSYRQTAYVDKGHKTRLYVRQGLVLRSGPVVVDLDNAFVPASDKGAKSFAPTEAIAVKQLTKIASSMPSGSLAVKAALPKTVNQHYS